MFYFDCRNKRLQCDDWWEKKLFDQPVKNNIRTYGNIRKFALGQGDECTTGFLLDHKYFKHYYNLITKDLSKQQALDADPKAIQQINFTENLDRAESTRCFSSLKKQNKSS